MSTSEKPKPTAAFAAPALSFVRRRWLGLSIAAALVLCYILAGFFLVPYLARSQLNDYVTQTLHRQVTVGEIRFNPLTFEASVSNLALKEADGSPLVGLRHLYVNAELASIWQRAVVLKEVQLAAPDIQLIVGRDGSVNLARLVPPAPPSAAPAPKPEEQTPLPRVRIGKLAVYEGRIGLADYSRSRPFTATLAPVKFTLSDFRTDAGYENAYAFAGTTHAGERLEWAGDFTLQPLGSNGRFSVQDLKMATIDSFAEESLPFRLASGSASLHGAYKLAMNDQLSLAITLPTVQVRELSLAEHRKGAKAPISIAGIELQDVAFSYEKHEVALKRVEVTDAKIDVAREKDGSISLMRLFGANAASASTPSGGSEAASKDKAPSKAQSSSADDAPAAPAAQPPPSAQWLARVDTIHLSNAAVAAEDRTVSPVAKFDLAPIELTVNGWSTDPAAKLQLDTDITINKTGKLLGKGTAQLTPLQTQLAIDLNDFALPVIQPYLAGTTAMTLHSGKLQVKGDLAYAERPGKAAPLSFKGEVQVADLRTTDNLVNQDFIKWRNLAISGIDYRQNPDQLTIDKIVARQPYANVVIAKNRTLNVTSVLNPGMASQPQEPQAEANDAAADAQATTPAKSKQDRAKQRTRVAKRTAAPASTKAAAPSKPTGEPTSPMLPMRIKTIQFIDGSANFADLSIEPSFASGILSLNGSVTGLSSAPGSRAKVKLTGKVDKYAPVDINGEVNLLSAALYTDLALNFRNMELTTFNPYSGKFAGYNITKGKLSTELKYHVEDRKLEAAHHIVLDNLQFGAKTDSKDAAPIPLKLAVAILKDRNGIIDLNLPVTGTLDDPKFRLGPVIWKAVIGLLTKIVTAPFAAIGALFGGGPELSYVDFPAGLATLAPPQVQKLDTLAKALIERPQLRLSLPQTVITSEDGDALARAALASKLPEPLPEPVDDAAKRKRVAEYEKLYKQLLKAAPEYPEATKTEQGVDLDARFKFLEDALLQQLRPDDAALAALAQQRARAVQDALLAHTELNPERVFITSERTEGKPENGAVRMEMKLE